MSTSLSSTFICYMAFSSLSSLSYSGGRSSLLLDDPGVLSFSSLSSTTSSTLVVCALLSCLFSFPFCWELQFLAICPSFLQRKHFLSFWSLTCSSFDSPVVQAASTSIASGSRGGFPELGLGAAAFGVAFQQLCRELSQFFGFSPRLAFVSAHISTLLLACHCQSSRVAGRGRSHNRSQCKEVGSSCLK
jgi:hypothetical protein